MQLRDRGIYCLPNGRELVVYTYGDNGEPSYKLSGSTVSDITEYDVGEDGRLFNGGRMTAWDVRDLSDTGRTHY